VRISVLAVGLGADHVQLVEGNAAQVHGEFL
jgi:hypothetical protein